MANVTRLSLEQQQASIRNRSRIITAVLMGIFAFFLFVYPIELFKDTIPPKDEVPYKVVGRIDFGNMTEGSKNVNNFKPPTPDPVKEADPKPTPQTKPTPTVPEKTIAQKEESEVKTTPPPKTEAKTSPKPTPAPAKTEPKPEATTANKGGSNHGNAAAGTGNRGTPTSPKLDDKGLYSLGDGIAAEGLNGRGLLNEFKPRSCGNCGESGKIIFVITIGPDGRVVAVRPKSDPGIPRSKPLIIAALKALKFDPVPGGGNQDVTITVNVKAE